MCGECIHPENLLFLSSFSFLHRKTSYFFVLVCYLWKCMDKTALLEIFISTIDIVCFRLIHTDWYYCYSNCSCIKWKTPILVVVSEGWHGGYPRLPLSSPDCWHHDTEVDTQSAHEWLCRRLGLWTQVQTYPAANGLITMILSACKVCVW